MNYRFFKNFPTQTNSSKKLILVECNPKATEMERKAIKEVRQLVNMLT